MTVRSINSCLQTKGIKIKGKLAAKSSTAVLLMPAALIGSLSFIAKKKLSVTVFEEELMTGQREARIISEPELAKA